MVCTYLQYALKTLILYGVSCGTLDRVKNAYNMFTVFS